MVRSMSSTLDPEARQHQTALQTTMQAFIKLMKSDKHDKSNYVNYIKDIKFLLDSHVPHLVAQEPKDVVKMVMTTI